MSYKVAKAKRRIRCHPAVIPLVDYAERQGFRVYFNDRNASSWSFGLCHWEDGDRRIVIFLRRPDGHPWSLADIIFILAHEIRHVEHQAAGLFPFYYDESDDGRDWCYFKAALAAERDCDAHARHYVARHLGAGASSILKDRLYPAWRVSPRFLPDGPRYQRWLIDAAYRQRLEWRPTGLEPELFSDDPAGSGIGGDGEVKVAWMQDLSEAASSLIRLLQSLGAKPSSHGSSASRPNATSPC